MDDEEIEYTLTYEAVMSGRRAGFSVDDLITAVRTHDSVHRYERSWQGLVATFVWLPDGRYIKLISEQDRLSARRTVLVVGSMSATDITYFRRKTR